ncbi:MAG: acyl carrier protein, partial [Anaerococcus vaginalis]|nr:acyl carrier protein [Anaerococcus vaginalis]
MSRNKEAINLSWLVEKWTIWDNSYLKNIWLNLDTLDLIRINDDMDNNDDIEESYIDI